MKRRIPDWLLEQMALGELPPDRERAIATRLAVDPEAQARLEAIHASNRAFHERHPPRRIVASIRARLSPKKRPLPHLPIAAAAASLAALILVLPRIFPEPGEGSRAKGLGPSLLVHRSAGGAIETLSDGAHARGGDLVQLSYVVARRAHGAILSIDGAGTISLHLPLEGDRSVPLEAGRAVPLSHAYELDDAPSFERFFFLTSEAPFSLEEILEAARRAGPTADRLPLGEAIEQTTFLLRKP